jgi:hypothetical protein
MGHLLSSAIKMQGAAAAPTLQINNLGGLNNCSWIKNGVSQGSVTGTLNVTLTAGDTFSVAASNVFDGATIDYFLNGSYVTSYSDNPVAQTPTITSADGNAYKFDCYGGF